MKIFSHLRKAQFGTIIASVTLSIVLGSFFVLQRGSSESAQNNQKTEVSIQNKDGESQTPNEEDALNNDVKGVETSENNSDTTDDQAENDTNQNTNPTVPAAQTQDEPEASENPSQDQTPDTQPRLSAFVKGGEGQSGSTVNISSIISGSEPDLPPGTCYYVFTNQGYDKATYSNRSSKRGCVAQMPVSSFPYSSDTWYYNGGNYKADDGSVLIPGNYQYKWPTVVIRAQDVAFSRVSASPNGDFLSINAFLNKKVPGTCTTVLSSVANPSQKITRTSYTIGPTQITQPSNSGEAMCGNAFNYTELSDLGPHNYTITFRDNVGYIVKTISGTTPALN